MTTPPADDLTGGLQQFGLQRDRMRTALARRAGIGATDLDALSTWRRTAADQRDLCERLSLTSGAVTMLVDRLERAGWGHRRPHSGDRRYVLIELRRARRPARQKGSPPTTPDSGARSRGARRHREAVAAFLAAATAAAAAAAGEISR